MYDRNNVQSTGMINTVDADGTKLLRSTVLFGKKQLAKGIDTCV